MKGGRDLLLSLVFPFLIGDNRGIFMKMELPAKQISLIVRKYKEGISLNGIARRMGLSRTKIKSVLCDQGVYVPVDKNCRKSKIDEVSEEEVWKRAQEISSRWSDHERLRRMGIARGGVLGYCVARSGRGLIFKSFYV